MIVEIKCKSTMIGMIKRHNAQDTKCQKVSKLLMMVQEPDQTR